MTETLQEYFWDGYLHWTGLMETAVEGLTPALGQMATQPAMILVEPIFVRLTAEPGAATSTMLRTGAFDPSLDVSRLPELSFLASSDHYFDVRDILIGFERAVSAQAPVEFFLYRPVARNMATHQAYDRVYTIIDVGAPALLRDTPAPFTAHPDARPSAAPSGRIDAIGAVIDNDIGFLNTTFRHGHGTQAGTTRFHAIWLQSRECVASTSMAPVNAVQMGRVLYKSDIDVMLNDPRDEVRIYQGINADLHVWEPFRGAPPMHTHGTAVADLAYGRGMRLADPSMETPLMAVQLPPEAAVDTTGTHSESYIVQGVRWLCDEARRTAPGARLVINISYGVLAGQKDGGKFIEAQIAREVTLAEALGQTVHVVYAFGNSLNSRQVAQLKLAPGAASEPLGWTIHPDDPVPNFLEIRALTQDQPPHLASPPDGIELTVIAPDGNTVLCATPGPGCAEPPLGAARAGAAARLYHVPARHCAGRPDTLGFYNLAIAPTVRVGPDLPVAPAGEWQIGIRNTKDAPTDLILQIQRGDRAPGFDIGGRQSFFSGGALPVVVDDQHGWDVELPLTNDGTSSAFATALHPRIHTVSADKDVLGEVCAAGYASRGAAWVGVPTASQRRVVDQVFTYGRRTVGTYSGTTSRLSGSSGAAALVSRELVATGPAAIG